MPPPPLALSGYPLVHSRSLEETRALYSRTVTPVQLERLGRGSDFEWRSNGLALGALRIASSWYRTPFRASTRMTEDVYPLSLPLGLKRGTQFLVNGLAVPMHGEAVFLGSPGVAVTASIGAGQQTMSLVVPRGVMEDAFHSLTGSRPTEPLVFEPWADAARGVGTSIRRLLWVLIQEIEQSASLSTSPLLITKLTDALLYLLLSGQPHSLRQRFQQEPRAPGPRHLRRAEEYMAAHCAEPISLAELAAVTGVSVRSLQSAFREHRGCTVVEFLRGLRLDLARHQLQTHPGTTVALVASGCGFGHFGRFSQHYRARFGESPMVTLARAAQRLRARSDLTARRAACAGSG